MRFLAENAWLAVLVPLSLAAIVAALGSKRIVVTRWLATLGPLVVLASGAAGVALQPSRPRGEILGGEVLARGSIAWLGSGADAIRAGFAFDGLGAVMLVVVGLVALMVMLFSVGYMAEERGLARYYGVLSLFTAAMATLVLADGFVTAFVGWEVMGACSYLLIGFWFDRDSASAAATKAFLVTRVGDAALMVGLAVLWVGGGLGAFADLPAVASSMAPAAVTLAALLVLAGAVGKSAQFPLHVWLPDAMEGPTPVSALIHAATMVAAGVFLVVRAWPLFAAAPAARGLALALGTITALGAAACALAQTDLKKVLAYSTLSQLGFMFAALGAGSPVGATFHLVTHAAFKSLLFLAAGSVIHGCGTQDLREMGGLAKRMPVTATAWVVGALALAGIPPLAGFFSKDAVLHAVFSANPVAGVALFAASALTALYITRGTLLAFFTPPRTDLHAHEAVPMTAPLVVLAVPALGAGLLGARILAAAGGPAEGIALGIAGVALALGACGIAAGFALYRRGLDGDIALSLALGPVWPALQSAFGIDGLWRRLFGDGTIAVARVAYTRLDRSLIDRIAEGTGELAERLGRGFGTLQNGDAQWYSALLGAGVIVALALALWGGR